MTQKLAPVATDTDAELRALFTRMCRAWTDGDARAYGDCFTSDMDYVSFDGHREQSHEAMVQSHDKLFRGVLYGSAHALARDRRAASTSSRLSSGNASKMRSSGRPRSR
jgi:hypothetical protein